MTTSIPADQLVRVIPSVLGAGSNELALNTVFVDDNAAIPVGQVLAFTYDGVKNFFGSSSLEAALAQVYFNGFNGATLLPGTLYFARWNASAVAAYLRSAQLSLSLADLQALSGTLIVAINGRTVTSASINLASATSFSNAASLITAGLQAVGGIFSGTVTMTGTLDMTVESVASGRLHTGDSVLIDGTQTLIVESQSSGTPGGIGVYVMSGTGTHASTSATVTSTAAATYDAQRKAFIITSPTTGVGSTIGYASGTLAAGISLTEVAGAVISIGADAAVAADVMDSITQVTQNWANFMTLWEPALNGKLAFADWVTGTNDRYAYVCWDTDVGPTTSEDDSGSFGRLTETFDGVEAIWGPADKAAFFCGTAASIDFDATQGRITFAYKSQDGLTPDVTDVTVATNLLANGYCFYGSYSSANQTYQFFQNGQISGDWNWADAYLNQIKLNSDLQVAFLDLFSTIKSVPYIQRGYNLLRAAAADPINKHLNFGSIQPGVELSARQIAEIDTAAGQTGVGRTVSQVGYYLQIKPAQADVRVTRGSPPMTLWYADGGSIQRINLASIDVQ